MQLKRSWRSEILQLALLLDDSYDIVGTKSRKKK